MCAGFDGCYDYVRYNGELLPFSGEHRAVSTSISGPDDSVKLGCRGPDMCSSAPCWDGMMCVNQWFSYQCVPPGECVSGPCSNGGSCVPGARGGFTCVCEESYTGVACETPVACLGVACPQGTACTAGGQGRFTCSAAAAGFVLPVWAVPAIVGGCAMVLALLVLGLILHNHCRGGAQAATPKGKKEKKKGSENVAFDDHMGGVDMAVRKQPEGNPKPDIIERENPYLIYDEGMEVGHAQPSAPELVDAEHYDIDNASSIAPSDADVVQHYRHFRSHTPKFSIQIQRHSPLGYARQSPLTLGGSGYAYQPTYTPGLRQTPLSHAPCPTRHSPAHFSKPPVAPYYRNTPTRELNLDLHAEARTSPPVFSYAPSRLGRRSKSPQTMAGHGSRPASRLKQPVEQIPPESGPPIGLSIEEVERLNTPRPRNPSICSADHGRSSSEDDARRPLSRIRNPADGIPAPDSSSDSDSHDSFTCSEMEYDRDRGGPARASKLSQLNESDADDDEDYRAGGGGARIKQRRYSSRRAEGGPGNPRGAFGEHHTLPHKLSHSSGSLDWDSLLSWGPGFSHYVDVFKDLALLPENPTAAKALEMKSGSLTMVTEGESEQYV